jgi:hypothetical protein
MGKILRVFSPALLVLVCSTAAHAEPFTILPNGDLVFNVALSTNGLFTCGSVVLCTGSGTNSITLESGQGTATFTFTAASTSFAVGNTTIPVTLGTFTGSTTAGFGVPDLNPNLALFSFGLTLSHSSPLAALAGLGWRFNSSFTRFGEEGNTYLALPPGPQPPQFQYGSIIYTMRVFPLTLPLNGSRDLVADTGVVPEPASLILVSSGLVAAVLRRRRTSSRSK